MLRQVLPMFATGLAAGTLLVFGFHALGSSESPTQAAPAGEAPATTPAPRVATPKPRTVKPPSPKSPTESVPKTATSIEPENELCPVMGNPVNPEVFVDYRGRRIGFCCKGCDAVFLKNPDKYLGKLDRELADKGEAK